MKHPIKKPGLPHKKPEAARKAAPTHMPEETKWKAQEALHTLRRAEEIKSDPELMGHVQMHAKHERAHLGKIIRRKVT